MDLAKEALIAVVIPAFAIAFSALAACEEPKGRTQIYEYSGTIQAKGEGTHILKVQTRSGIKNFHYQRHGKKQCAGFKELNAGDSVKVTAADDKPVSEATCILKVRPDAPTK